MLLAGCCLPPAAVRCLLPLFAALYGLLPYVCSPIALQALLWARKVRSLLAQLPPANSQQAPAAQEQSQQQNQQQPEAAAASAAEQQQPQAEAEASPAAAEEAAVAEVQEQLLSAVEAAEGKAAAAALAWEKRPPLSGGHTAPACLLCWSYCDCC
jgi:predicted lipid-binding transport protein (Tim44 family)